VYFFLQKSEDFKIVKCAKKVSKKKEENLRKDVKHARRKCRKRKEKICRQDVIRQVGNVGRERKSFVESS